MVKFKLNTGRNREITVESGWVGIIGEVFLTTEEMNIYPADLVHSRLKSDQARDLAQALLNSADEVDGAKPQPTTDELNARIAELESRLAEYEPEQLYYIKVLDNDVGYLNVHMSRFVDIILDGKEGSEWWQTKFTQAEIDGNPEIKKLEQFKVRVEED